MVDVRRNGKLTSNVMRIVSETSAWTSPSFRSLWRASALSVTGSEIGEIAVPVLALLTLGATATDLSWIRVALFLPFLLCTLPLGALVERRPRRGLMLIADLVRGVLLLAIAGLAIAGILTVPTLVVLVAIVGTCTVLYTLADFSYLPQVLTTQQLPDGNARLTATQSALGIAGQGLGGGLVQAITAPFALLVNGLTYLGSAFFLRRIKQVEEPAKGTRGTGERGPWAGMRALWREHRVRALAAEATIWNFGNEVLMLSLTILIIRTYSLGPLTLGVILMVGGFGAFVGSALSAKLTRTIGYGPGLLLALSVGNSAPLAVIVLTNDNMWRVTVLAVAFLISGLGLGVANSQAVTVRQLSVPEHERARVNAAYRFLSWGALALGALGAGALINLLGTYHAAIVGAVIMALAGIPVALSPVRHMRSTIEPAHDRTTTAQRGH